MLKALCRAFLDELTDNDERVVRELKTFPILRPTWPKSIPYSGLEIATNTVAFAT